MTEDDLEMIRLREQVYSLQNKLMEANKEIHMLKTSVQVLARSAASLHDNLQTAVEMIEILRNDKFVLEEQLGEMEDHIGSLQANNPNTSYSRN